MINEIYLLGKTRGIKKEKKMIREGNCMDKFLSRRIPITLKRLEKIIQASSDEANAEEQS